MRREAPALSLIGAYIASISVGVVLVSFAFGDQDAALTCWAFGLVLAGMSAFFAHREMRARAAAAESDDQSGASLRRLGAPASRRG